MMIDKNLSMADIAEKINREFDDNLSCIFIGNNADKLVLRLRITSDETLKGDVQNESAEDDVVFKKIESNMLTEMALRGILDIKKVFIKEVKVNKFDDNGGFKPVEERMLDTDGVDLLAVMCHEDVDATRTTSNHLTEVIEVLGIEAARRVLLDELRVVISFDGSYVNYRHLALLCDTMTYRGHLMAIKGHGINRNETGPFMRCSFEETVDILIDAAVYAESDYLRGATENIMLGQLAPIGTGGCSLFLNDRILNQAIELQLSSHMEGLDFGMTATPSPLSRTPYHEGMISPDFRASPIDTNALDSPYVRHMALSPIPSQGGYCQYSGGNNPSPIPGSQKSYKTFSSLYTPPIYTPISHASIPASPLNAPTSTSHTYSPSGPIDTRPRLVYSQIPSYSPTTPCYNHVSPMYSPISSDNPAAPNYSYMSQVYGPTTATYSPTSPAYSPTAPSYKSAAPSYSPTSTFYNPSSVKYSLSTYSPSNPRMTLDSQISPSYSPTSPTYSLTSPMYSLQSPSYNLTSPIDDSGLELISQKYNAQKMPIYLITSRIVDEILGRGPGKSHSSDTTFNSGSSKYCHPDARGYLESGCRPHVGRVVPKNKEDYIAFRSLDLGEELEKMDNTHRQIMRKEMQNSRASVSYLWQLNEARGQKCKLIRRDIAAVGGSCQEIPAYLIRQY